MSITASEKLSRIAAFCLWDPHFRCSRFTFQPDHRHYQATLAYCENWDDKDATIRSQTITIPRNAAFTALQHDPTALTNAVWNALQHGMQALRLPDKPSQPGQDLEQRIKHWLNRSPLTVVTTAMSCEPSHVRREREATTLLDEALQVIEQLQARERWLVQRNSKAP